MLVFFVFLNLFLLFYVQVVRSEIPQKLNQSQRNDIENELPDWELLEDKDAIKRTFIFKDFVECYGM